ncbi:MAG: beta-ketoacyl synthase N-terminal-like domain-containing protein, partial [Blastocatellia bacterium]
MRTRDLGDATGSEIAVIGMACRLPGARDVSAFWQNLRNGIEAIRFLSDSELERSVVDPSDLDKANYVKAAAILDDVDMFDASFFGYTPREAEILDPQHRLFLECAWESLESAGYVRGLERDAVGVFAGARTNTYLFNLFVSQSKLADIGAFEIGLGNDLAFLTSRVSYKLDLRGPSYAVHTACSTSLVAIHLACQSLLVDECRMALAGGVAINVPQKTGYQHTSGSITSPDGHCRPFDRRAEGTIFGSGVGVVVLKKLGDALSDGDTI